MSVISSPSGVRGGARPKTVSGAFWSQKSHLRQGETQFQVTVFAYYIHLYSPSNVLWLKNWYAKSYGWRTSFKTATPVASWRTGSATYATSFTVTKRFICSGGRESQPTTDRERRERIELPDWVPSQTLKKWQILKICALENFSGGRILHCSSNRKIMKCF